MPNQSSVNCLEFVDLVFKILGGVLTLTIATLAIIIAYRQYKTASDNLRLALYERRYKVYCGLMNFLGAVERDVSVSREDLSKFYSETDQKRFLFKKELRDYLTEVREKARVPLLERSSRVPLLPGEWGRISSQRLPRPEAVLRLVPTWILTAA